MNASSRPGSRPSTTLYGPALVVSSTKRMGKRLVVVFSPKGGVGTTTVAVNLGLGMAGRSPDGVALIDLTPGGGHVASNLNVRPKATIADLANDTSLAKDQGAMRSTYLTAAERGVLVMAG